MGSNHGVNQNHGVSQLDISINRLWKREYLEHTEKTKIHHIKYLIILMTTTIAANMTINEINLRAL